MKSRLGILSLMAMAALSEHHPSSNTGIYKPRDKKNDPKKQDELKRKKGLSEFYYGENRVWALNQKSADKKASKKGWI